MNKVCDEEILVILHPDQDPPFHLEYKGSKLKKVNKPGDPNHYEFKNEPDEEGFLITYTLVNPPKTPDKEKYYFPDDPLEAMYSAKGAGCPSTVTHWGEFWPDDVKNRRKLIVRNMNKEKTEFGYTLRVTQDPDGPDPKFLPLDPGGTNSNGGWSRSEVNYLKVALIGATTGILSAVATTLVLQQMNLLCRTM
jgi:hypothetical protein